MPELRLFFEKTGPARWLSHLDVMHTFSRAFLRGGLPLRHSEGFNPHPYLSIAHPLPVGVEGLREVLDVETLSAGPDGIAEKLNATLPEGLRILAAATPVEPARKIAFAVYRLSFLYDRQMPDGNELSAFFAKDPIPVMKRGKRGETEINLRAAYTSFRLLTEEPGELLAETVVDASQAPVNPKYFAAALSATSLSPDQLRASRTGFLNMEGNCFE